MEHEVRDPSQFLGTETINWLRIGRAVRFYQDRGYNYVEVPWVVPRRITEATVPPSSRIYSVDDNADLVGSAEQSFLWLAERGELCHRHLVAVSPCFRGDTLSPIHQNTFMKVELFCSQAADTDLRSLVHDARDFFRSEGVPVQCVDTSALTGTENSVDLQVEGVEIGSYGIRSQNGLTWAYGTGLAEPRFSVAKRKVL